MNIHAAANGFIIAYNLGNHWRRLVLLEGIDKWSLTILQPRLVKMASDW